MPISGSLFGVRRRAFWRGLAAVGAQVFSSSSEPCARRCRWSDRPRDSTTRPLGVPRKPAHRLVKWRSTPSTRKGGLLGRPVQPAVEDSTSGGRWDLAVMQARKLIGGEKASTSCSDVELGPVRRPWRRCSNEKAILHIVPGGHTDAVNLPLSRHGTCPGLYHHAQMEVISVAGVLIRGVRKKLALHYAGPTPSPTPSKQGLAEAIACWRGRKNRRRS